MAMIAPSGRRALLIGGAVAAAGLARPVIAKPTGDGPWSVELFTSQGCNSCPPADAYLGRLAVRPDIVALSFHVDYWDYIGWKDPYASRETTERQRAYARVLKQRYVYTPEMVVDGIGHDTGRERGPIEALLAKAQALSPTRATPLLARNVKGPLSIKLDSFPMNGRKADVTLAIYDRRHSTPVRSGENQGRMLENFNVVRHFELVSRWNGTATSWTIAGDRIGPTQGVAVLVQHADHGPMIGCNKLEPAYSG
jgi:hypothetical protein